MYNSFSLLTYPFFCSPQLEFFVSCDLVWPPPPPYLFCEMSVGDEVEVSSTNPNITLVINKLRSVGCRSPPVVSQIYSRNSDGEPFGWWLARIQMMIGEVILLLIQTKKNCIIKNQTIFKKLLVLRFSQWCLIEYAAGGQEFVLPESIRPFNPNRFYSVETLVWSYFSEGNVRLQVLRTHGSHGCVNTLLSVTSDPSVALPDHVGAREWPCRGREEGWRRSHRPSASWRGWCWMAGDPRHRKQKLVTQLSEQWGPQQPAIWLWWVEKRNWKKRKLHELSKMVVVVFLYRRTCWGKWCLHRRITDVQKRMSGLGSETWVSEMNASHRKRETVLSTRELLLFVF